MKIGLTYDLQSEYLAMGYSKEETAELDQKETIDGIENALQLLGYETVRIGHARRLMQSLLSGEKWDLVFNICEGLHGNGRESLVPALLDAFRIPYVFSGPATLALSLNKATCKRVVRDAGIATPDFCLVRSTKELAYPKPTFPIFIKPFSEGTGKGINESSMVKNNKQYKIVCTNLLKRFHQPVLVESFLPGREFTVGVIGNGADAHVIGCMEVLFNKNSSEFYSYENKEKYKEKVYYQNTTGDLLRKCTVLALQVWHITGARDGGRIDMKLNNSGIPEFIEINPLAGLNLHHSDLPILANMNGISFQELITMIMQAAEKRIFGKVLSASGSKEHTTYLSCNE